MPNQEKIFICVTKSNMGGAQKYVLSLAHAYKNKGLNVVIVAGGTGKLYTEAQKLQIPFHVLQHSKRDISLLTEWKYLLELYTLFKKERPTIIHLNSSKIAGLGVIVGRILRIPHIIFTSHGWAFNEPRSFLSKFLMRIIYWIIMFFSHTTICVSKNTAQQVQSFPFVQKKIQVIYNGIPLPHFLDKNHARDFLVSIMPRLDSTKKWLVILAELHPIKGHEIAFEVISSFESELTNYQIVCIGDGELEEKLQQFIVQKSLENKVIFSGFIAHASNYLKGFDGFILPSLSEGMPLSVLEAGLAEIPIIASHVGGIPEIIDSHTGFLFEKKNKDQFKICLQKFLNTPPEKLEEMTQALSEKIKEDFSLEHMTEKTLRLYKKSNS